LGTLVQLAMMAKERLTKLFKSEQFGKTAKSEMSVRPLQVLIVATRADDPNRAGSDGDWLLEVAMLKLCTKVPICGFAVTPRFGVHE
jgi:hypothetical protein